MKLLVDHDLAALNAFLASVNVGDYVVSGQVESYSCTCVCVFSCARACRGCEGVETGARGEGARALAFETEEHFGCALTIMTRVRACRLMCR